MPRVSEYTQEMADAICERLAQGRSLRSLCADEDMPAVSTVCKWLTREPAFVEQYTRAREAQADALFDEILDIADETEVSTKMDGEEVTLALDSVAIQRNRLRVDARKWMAGKLRPKVYGEKLDLNHAGGVEITRVTRQIIDPKAAT